MSVLRDTELFTICTGGYVPFALNLHASLEKLGLSEHLVVYALDEVAQRDLEKAGVRCKTWELEGARPWSDWNTPDFVRTTASKFEIALDIFNQGKHSLYCDSDIVFLENPFEVIRDQIIDRRPDLVMQFENARPHHDAAYNTGFWWAANNSLVAEVFSTVVTVLRSGNFNCDQRCFNSLIDKNSAINITALDAQRFPCGREFYRNPALVKSAYLLHFNYKVGFTEKTRYMKLHGGIFHPSLATTTVERVLVSLTHRMSPQTSMSVMRWSAAIRRRARSAIDRIAPAKSSYRQADKFH